MTASRRQIGASIVPYSVFCVHFLCVTKEPAEFTASLINQHLYKLKRRKASISQVTQHCQQAPYQ